jgi:hypothetical protein
MRDLFLMSGLIDMVEVGNLIMPKSFIKNYYVVLIVVKRDSLDGIPKIMRTV